MKTTKIGFFTDLHVAGQAPASRQDDYTGSVLKKLAFCLRRCSAECDVIVFGGDMTHSHKLGNDRLKERLLDVFIENLTVPFFYTYGQHDLRGEDLSSREESTTAFIMRMLSRLGKTVVELKHTTWTRYPGARVDFAACPRGVEPVAWFRDLPCGCCTDASGRIVVAHHLISDKASSWLLDYKSLQTEGVMRPRDNGPSRVIDVVLSGDLHCGFGPCLNQSGTLFVNPGSLARTAKSKTELVRAIQGAQLDVTETDDGVKTQVTLWPVECARPGAEVFRESAPLLEDEAPVSPEPAEAETKTFDEVVARLSNVKVRRVDVWDLLEKRAREVELDPAVRSYLLSKRPDA